MDINTRRTGALIMAALLITVITQLVYVKWLGGVGIIEGWPLRSALWSIELFAFTVIAVASLALLVRDTGRAFIWSALAISGMLNIIQAGIGLSMFMPMTEAGEQFAPMMGVIVGGAFLFYFLAKVLLGLAAIGLGFILFSSGGGAGKIVGALSIIAGLAAAAVNMVAIPQGMMLVFEAGAAGTAAALITALAIWMVTRRAD